ncbi:MAG: peptide/nickel transport system substrate-binding protein [Solirubrobacterales bacterium]|jgi:peptide/nickel transport system substrate-binding protein|nr:peptide/nickel transport system substrate-binding protein [Solirubrobacterales bacterium]
MPTKLRWLLALGAFVALALAVSACGSDNSSSSSSGGTSSAGEQFAPSTEAPADAKQGGDLTVIAASDVDYIDPGAQYYQFSYMVSSATQSTLVGYAPGDIDAQPLLAAELPTVSSDGKTITYTLRDDVMYSPAPPDGDQSWKPRAATAADVKYAIERSLLPGVPNGYVQTYLSGVDGIDAAVKAAQADPTGGAPDISGITAPNDTTLVIKLTNTSALGVEGALSLPVSAPVPADYAEQYDAENPSTYGENQVSTGPYMVNSYTPNKEIALVRNPNWKASDADYRPAYLDNITFQEGFADTVSAGKKVLAGNAEVNGDFSAPPGVIKQAATSGEPGQLTVTPSGGNRYIALNTQEPPFDDINIRKAVIAGSNRTDLRNTRGGELVGPVATHFLPPDFPGFEEAGGLEGAGQDFVANPDGDPAVSAKYFKAAGMSSGKCEGSDCTITMVGDDSPPGSDTAEVFKSQLEEMGFDVNFQKVTHDIMYTKFCSVPDNAPDVCPNVGWLKDFNDGQSMLDPTFNGENVVPENNSNWPQLNVPEINKAIDAATLVDNQDERNQAWGDVDKMITDQAPAVPWVWDNQANIASADVAGVINKFNANWDLSFTSLK